ncbi:hypothetical protein OIU76_028690 [Salix suchowensis]|nr:hypothetical protein OIU76_028690 [Salix suchowensis]
MQETHNHVKANKLPALASGIPDGNAKSALVHKLPAHHPFLLDGDPMKRGTYYKDAFARHELKHGMEFVQNWRRAAEAVADYAGCENLAKTTAKTLRQNITTHFLCNPAFNANYCAQDFPSLQSSQLFPPLFRPQEAQVPPPHFLVPPPPNQNGDGKITKKELNDSLENLGIFIHDKELTQMIETIDANGDGFVDIDEFGEL